MVTLSFQTYSKLLRFNLVIFFIIQWALGYSEHNRIALFDLTARNAETTSGNVYSAEHLLKVSGLPYFVTTSLDEATEAAMIVFSSNIETNTFSSSEITAIQNFVNGGGVAVVTQQKDPRLNSLFGISGISPLNTRHYSFHFKTSTNPRIFRWINDENEKNIILGDSTMYTDVINSRSYAVTSATIFGLFGDQTAGLTVNKSGQGYAYALGLNWRDVVLRNQIIGSYNSYRTYSNGFEPGSDVFMLFLKGIYTYHNSFAIWKHTSGLNSNASLIITHDVDATTSIRDMMSNFATYEYANDIKATYFVTTHYMHDSIAKDFWTNYTNDVAGLKKYDHEIASHSVSHVPDFDNETIVPEGTPGNTKLTYSPFYNGHFSSNVTVYGETEVSKYLLEQITNLRIRSYRAGYLLYNKKLLNVLAQKNYEFNSSLSANNVLTAFPFFGHYDLSMSGALSNVLEIPNTISDVFMADPISELNYSIKSDIWKDVQNRNAENSAPTILLIHPNRWWKIKAEQNLIQNLAKGTRIVPFEHFGDYWKARDSFHFQYDVSPDSIITITIHSASLPLHPDLSIIVDNGQSAKAIKIQNEDGNIVSLTKSNWKENGVILHSSPFTENYQQFTYSDSHEELTDFSVFPNPTSNKTTFEFSLMTNGPLKLDIFNSSGMLVETLLDDNLSIGHYSYSFTSANLSSGIYYFRLTTANSAKTGKIVVTP